jgi:hypothetical protein
LELRRTEPLQQLSISALLVSAPELVVEIPRVEKARLFSAADDVWPAASSDAIATKLRPSRRFAL